VPANLPICIRVLHVDRDPTPQLSDELTGPSTSIPLAPTSPSPPSQPASRTASPVPAPLVCTPINSTPIPESIVPTPAPIPVVTPPVSPAITSRPSTPAPPTPNLVPFVPNVVPPHDISSLQAQIQEMSDHSQRSYDAALREFEWGPEWAQCLVAFVGFERAAGFVEYDTRLPTSSSQPVEIKNWFGASQGLESEPYELKSDDIVVRPFLICSKPLLTSLPRNSASTS
jgi:hypothetical protein